MGYLYMIDEKEKKATPAEAESEIEEESIFGVGNLNEYAEQIEEQTGGKLIKNVGCGG